MIFFGRTVRGQGRTAVGLPGAWRATMWKCRLGNTIIIIIIVIVIIIIITVIVIIIIIISRTYMSSVCDKLQHGLHFFSTSVWVQL